MAKLTLIGTGMMGSGLASAALARGDSVTVWNRTLDRARPLEKEGATVAPSLEAAVAGADRVHIILSDDAAVDSVLARIAGALAPGTPVIDHTTASPEGTKKRVQWCADHKIAFLSAPVFMSPQACRDATGIMLAAGPTALFDQLKPALEKMTGTLWYLGERPDLAAVYKLFGNAMIFTIVGGLSDVLELGASMGVDARDVMALFSKFKPAGTIDFRGPKMANLDFNATFELVMARKDLRLMLESMSPDVKLSVLPGIATRMDDLLAQGLGEKDVAVLAQEAVVRSRKTSGRGE